MNNMKCELICNWLVDYDDGVLADEATEQVRHHLDVCDECRAELARLRHSLSLASSVWGESLARVVEASPASNPLRHSLVPAMLQISVCAAVVLLGVILWLVSRNANDDVRSSIEVVRSEPHATNNSEMDEIDVDALIQREVQSARLAASARFLSETPELKEYKDQAEQYLADVYGVTVTGQRRDTPRTGDDT